MTAGKIPLTLFRGKAKTTGRMKIIFWYMTTDIVTLGNKANFVWTKDGNFRFPQI